MERPSSQRGSAIIMLFIAVALFGILAYAFMQSSRTSTSWLESERGKASATATADCANTLGLAVKRLEARGCTGMISMNADGTNTAPGAPTDGSCSVYHPNGGGAKYCGAGPVVAGPPCGTSPSIGLICSDGTIYAGNTPDGNVEMYTTPSDATALTWNDGSTNYFWTNLSNQVTGKANTAALVGMDADPVAPGNQDFVAAKYCSDLSSNGHTDWYLPARQELEVLLLNRNTGSLAGTVNGSFYWTSTEDFLTAGYYWAQDGLGGGSGAKHFSNMVRCVRTE